MKNNSAAHKQYLNHFDHHTLDSKLESFQLWSKGNMLTAQLPRMDAISGIKDRRFYVISPQAVGYATDLINNQ